MPRSPFAVLSFPRTDGAMLFAEAENKKRPGRYLAGIFLFVALAACTAVPSAAFAERGHVLSSTHIGEKCEPGEEPCPAGKLKEPSGVAASEASEDVYVIDTGNDRVEYFNEKGEVQGEFTGASATGTGKTEAGSTTISGVVKESGTFTAGEELSSLSAPGLKAGTTITAVESEEAGTLKLTISEPAETEEPMATLTAHQNFSFPSAVAETSGIATDNSCAVHHPALTPTTSPTCEEFDPSNGDVYVEDTGHGVIDKFTPSGTFVAQVSSGLEHFNGIAVDGKGELWAYQEDAVSGFPGARENAFGEHETVELKENGTGEESFHTGSSEPGFAVDSEDAFYTHLNRTVGENVVRKYSAAGKALTREVDPEVPTGVAVELASGDVYVGTGGSLARFSSSGAAVESLPVPGGGGGGVGVGSTNSEPEGSTLYVAEAGSDVVDVFVPQSPAAPSVESESVSAITPTDGNLSAQLNPRGAPSEYHFEYGRCASPDACAQTGYEASVPVPDTAVGSDYQIHGVTVHVEGLAPGSTYHFRVVVHNAEGSTDGPGQVFSTPSAGEQVSLPDNREWELVSPAERHGAVFRSDVLTESSLDGTALTYTSEGPTEANPHAVPKLSQILSRRGASGWSTQVIDVPQEGAGGSDEGSGEAYEFVNEELSAAVIQPKGTFPAPGSPNSLSPEASEQTAFLHDLNTGLSTPLVTGCPAEGQPCRQPVAEHADVPAGTVFGESLEFGGSEPCPYVANCGPLFVGSDPESSAVVLRSRAPLLKSNPPNPPIPTRALYEWRAGAPVHERLSLISVLPANAKGEEIPVAGSSFLGFESTVLHGAVSKGGSRVFWGSSEGNLYVRDVARSETLELDLPEAGCGECESGGGRFQFASADGSRVFFTDYGKLTSDSGVSHENEHDAADLYECELVVPPGGHLECKLQDLTPKPASGEPAKVQGVVGASTDGSYLYYVADGVQGEDAGAAKGSCEFGSDGVPLRLAGAVCNLYVLHHDAGSWERPRLVGVLSEEDEPDWKPNGNLARMNARVSPDGQYVAFMSDRPLTGYDNRDAVSGKPDEEVFLYDAASGHTSCASCNPSGDRPTGTELGGLGANLPVVGHALHGFESWVWISGSLPSSPTPGKEGGEVAPYQPRYLSNEGRLFFQSTDGLVPLDSNGVEDVYEYEPEDIKSPEGAEECSPSTSSGSEVYKPVRTSTVEAGTPRERAVSEGAGCVALISSGSSSEESAFLDASETGGDVFFLSAANLVGATLETGLSVYDAHQCTEAAPCFPAHAAQTPPCDTEASCKAAPSPQPGVFGAPSSQTFSGPGDLVPTPVAPVKPAILTRAQKLAAALKACRKDMREKKRSVCERQARRKYGPVKKRK